MVVAPTLVKQAPAPKRLFIGDMADEKKILLGLNIAFLNHLLTLKSLHDANDE